MRAAGTSSRARNLGLQLITAIVAGLVATMIEPARGQAPQPVLPSAIRDELTEVYPGWRFARIHPQAISELQADDGVRRSPEWVAGDYNRDGKRDYAVRIVRPDTSDSTQLILAFLSTRRGYDRSVVDAARSEHLGIYLRAARRGVRTRDYDRDPTGEKRFALRSDAIEIVFTEGAAMTCVYEGRRWRCFQSAD